MYDIQSNFFLGKMLQQQRTGKKFSGPIQCTQFSYECYQLRGGVESNEFRIDFHRISGIIIHLLNQSNCK